MVALADTSNKAHHVTVNCFRQILEQGTPLVTSTICMGEAFTTIRRILGYNAAISFYESARSASQLKILSITPAIDQAAWIILQRYPSVFMSYVEAVSLSIVAERGITQALTLSNLYQLVNCQKLVQL